MAHKVLSVSLSRRGIRAIKTRLEAYQLDLPNKMAEFFNRLSSEVGIPVVDAKYSSGLGDSSKDHTSAVIVTPTPTGAEGILRVEGKDLGFIEFGAGVHFNTPAGTSPHPKGVELGYTIGSYGYGLGRFELWWYTDESGNMQVSFGTEATMPVYSAAQEMRKEIMRICQEVFG